MTFQVEFRGKDTTKTEDLKAEDITFRLAGKTTIPINMDHLDLSRKVSSDVWLLILVWPGIDWEHKELDELMSQLRRSEKITWHIAAISPGTIGVAWYTDKAEQIHAIDEAFSSAKTFKAFNMVFNRVRPDSRTEEPLRDLWTAKVSNAMRELLAVNGRKELLEAVPPPDANLIMFYPGEKPLYSLARNGDIPVYRVIRVHDSLRSVIPFGDASYSPPLQPDQNTSGAQIGVNQRALVVARSDDQIFNQSRGGSVPQTGGGDFLTPSQAVQKMTADLAGGYQITLLAPSPCKPGLLYPLSVQVKDRKSKIVDFAPEYILARRSYAP